MGIFSRLADIVNSNINALLDSAEDPRKVIRLIIQEMEDTLVEVRSSAVRTIAERREIERRLEHLADEAAEWRRKAEIAVTRERDDLARAALSLAAQRDAEHAAIERQHTRLVEALAAQHEDVGKLQAKLAEAKAREQTLLARHVTAGNRVRVRETLHNERINDAFARFEHAERMLDRVEARAESYDIGRAPPPLDAELATLGGPDIDAELARLKARRAEPAEEPR